MSLDILDTIIKEIKASPFFALQLDESTDVESCAQLVVYVRYIKDETMKEEYLYSESLSTTTRGEDVFQSVKKSLINMSYNGQSWLVFVQMERQQCWAFVLDSRHSCKNLLNLQHTIIALYIAMLWQ